MIHLIYLTYIKEITPLKFLRNIDTNTELKGKGERKGEGNQQFLVSLLAYSSGQNGGCSNRALLHNEVASVLFLFPLVGIESRALHLINKYSTTEL
jgi:hypothetical protein